MVTDSLSVPIADGLLCPRMLRIHLKSVINFCLGNLSAYLQLAFFIRLKKNFFRWLKVLDLFLKWNFSSLNSLSISCFTNFFFISYCFFFSIFLPHALKNLVIQNESGIFKNFLISSKLYLWLWLPSMGNWGSISLLYISLISGLISRFYV